MNGPPVCSRYLMDKDGKIGVKEVWQRVKWMDPLDWVQNTRIFASHINIHQRPMLKTLNDGEYRMIFPVYAYQPLS